MIRRITRLCLLCFYCLGFKALGASEFYVAPQGGDQHPGTIEAPFGSLEAARDAIRKLKNANAFPKNGITVWVRGGNYERTQTFTLESQDSGASGQQPIVYRAYKGEAVHLNGGKCLAVWERVNANAILDRLPAKARNQVFVADLKALGLLEIPDFNPHGMWTARRDNDNVNGPWIYFKDKPMEVACWPNEDYDAIRDIPKDSTGDFRGWVANKEGKFYVDPEKAKIWGVEKDLWCSGYFAVKYADANQAVKSLNAATGLIELSPPHSGYGCTKEGIYRIANALSELDRPGEFKIDREGGKVFFWPPSPIQKNDAAVALLGSPHVEVRGASNITLNGFILELTRGSGVVIDGGSNVRFEACTIRNFGDWAVTIKNGANHAIVGCDISGGASGGVRIKAGDRPALVSCNHVVENCHIHDLARWNRTYHPGVNMDGVGITVRNCLIHDLPHTAIIFAGNDHIVEYNEIHSVGYATTESGAIYTDREWSFAGNHIRYNYFHDLYGPELVTGGAIHLDDAVSGIAIYGNVFHKICWGISHRGGQRIHVSNNVFTECRRSAIDIEYVYETKHRLAELLKRMPYQQPPWSTRYPDLVNALENNPDYATGSFYSNNVCYGAHFIEWHAKREHMSKMKALVPIGNNFWSVPGTLQIKRQDGILQVPLPAAAITAASFKALPLEEMGLLHKEFRASWPVENEVRPLPRVWQAALSMKAERPVCRVSKRKNTIEIDGTVDQKEWSDPARNVNWGEDPDEYIRLQKSANNSLVSLSSVARIRHDEKFLYFGITNPVDPSKPLRMGEEWGTSDSVELAIQDGQFAPGDTGVIYVLRGYATGNFQADNIGGASPEDIADLTRTVKYAARLEGPNQWSAEWRVPLSALNINLNGNRRIAFNLTAYKSVGDLWVMWHGTQAHSNDAGSAGILELGR